MNTGLPNNATPNPFIRYTKDQGIISIDDNFTGYNLVYIGSH